MPHVTVQWWSDGQEVPGFAMRGKYNLVMGTIPTVGGQRVRIARPEGGSVALNKQSSKPLLEECMVTLTDSDLQCRFTFESPEEALRFFQSANGRLEKQTATALPPAPPAQTAAPEPPRKKRSVDDVFTYMSTQGRDSLVGFSNKGPSTKRVAIDSRVTTSPEKNVVAIRPSRPLRAPAPPSSILQRRPSTPPQDSSIYAGYRPSFTFGLQNLGNTCYLNAVTQAMSSLREFVEDLRAMPKQLPEAAKGALFKCTVEILQKMQETSMSAPLSPAKLREQIAIAAPMFQGNAQQDAHEFFLEYMNQLHDELLTMHKGWLENGSGDPPLLATQSHFDAEVQRQLTCVQCGHVRRVSERFRDFSLDFSGGDRPEQLQAMIRRYFQAELLEATCEQCQASEANLDTNLAEAPRVLVLHLKRFVPNIEKQCYEKQHQGVEIPSWLDLGATLNGQGRGSPPRPPARPLASPSLDAPQSPEASSLCYSLRAIVSHEGPSPRSGHYVCYSKSPSGEWRLYDDSRVRRFSDGEEPHRELGRKAYMLFYVLKSPDAKAV